LLANVRVTDVGQHGRDASIGVEWKSEWAKMSDEWSGAVSGSRKKQAEQSAEWKVAER